MRSFWVLMPPLTVAPRRMAQPPARAHFLGALALGLLSAVCAQAGSPTLPVRGICAHRGASDTHPENTLAAFREAVRLGAHMIELDVGFTKDRQLVLMHDARVDRTTDGTGKLEDFTLAELKALDAGSWKGPQFAGEKIPTLDEALAMMPENVWLNVHLKGGIELAEQVARRIVAWGYLDQAFLACRADQSRAARRIEPRIKICNMERQSNSAEYVTDTIESKADFIQLKGGSIDPVQIRRLKDSGVRINYFGTNDAEEVRALLDSGVQFPLVDRVGEMLKVAGEMGIERLKAPFFVLCDVAARELNKEPRTPPRRWAFYVDAYVVRALAVGYDLTGRREYLDACKAWADRMIELQNSMTPRGAYSMNYGRKPGQDQGDWYVADSSSIGMAVLATAVRSTDPAEKSRYLSSVESFARLVMDNYVAPDGGITDGLWPIYDGPWWCSSGVFGSLVFLLYQETGDEVYLKAGLGALDWLNRLDFTKAQHISFEEAAPSVVMYVLEAYAAGMPYLEAGSQRHALAMAQIGKALEWMAANQGGRGKWDYNSQWGSKLGGLPFLMLVFARATPELADQALAANQELRQVSRVLWKDGEPALSQLCAFAMMSYAEQVEPGGVLRAANP